MNLKRNDKIILIVGVVILIIAGAGIALYSTPSEDLDIDTEDTSEMYYEYEWNQKKGSESVESPTLVEGTPFEQGYTITSPSGTILTQVTVHVDWVDDNTFGILRTKGQDTVTAEISLNGKSSDDSSSEVEGNLSFPFNVNSMPRTGDINASTSREASSQLIEKYKGMNTADFDVMLNIETGEPWWRFLFNRDKGNMVEISVSYTYYDYDLMEVENHDNSMKTTGDDDITVSSHALGEFYVNLGYGRSMI